ncbi:hypothetical protein MTO96_008965 [Rhipicephalus appendiculatus]
MPQPVRSALHRVCDTVSGVNWRPTRFADELTTTRYACHVCHVVPSTTIVLPCAHGMCELCHVGSPMQDGRRVCPLDGKSFGEGECQKCQLPVKKEDLEAYCWNEEHGCDFVGPLFKVLRHFEKECTFRVLPCERCGENVPHGTLSAHYASGCKSFPVNTDEVDRLSASCLLYQRNDWFEVSVLVESTLKSSSLKLDVIFNWDYAPGERRSFPEVARVAIVSSDGCFDLIQIRREWPPEPSDVPHTELEERLQ